MNKPLPYCVVQKATAFGTTDRVLSRHRTIEAAQRAFDRVIGRAVLIGPDGSIINHRIV